MTPEYLMAWQEAFQQRGKLLVEVFCELHAESAGEVRASPAGPIFVTRQILTPDPQWIQDKVAVRARGGDEGRVRPISSWGGYLFDHPARPRRVASILHWMSSSIRWHRATNCFSVMFNPFP